MLPVRLFQVGQQVIKSSRIRTTLAAHCRIAFAPGVASCSTNAESHLPPPPPTTTTTIGDGQQQREVDDLIASMEVLLKGHDTAVMDSYEKFVSMASHELGLPMRVEDRNRPHFVRMTLNRSPFIHKKHMRQYEFRTYCKTLHFSQLTGSTASVFLEYIQRNLPEGMAMHVKKERLEPLTEFLHKLNGDAGQSK